MTEKKRLHERIRINRAKESSIGKWHGSSNDVHRHSSIHPNGDGYH